MPVFPRSVAEPPPAGRVRGTAWGWTALACGIAVALASGCAAPTMKLGSEPRTDRLAELKVNVSSAKDVVAVLGEPQGRGAARAQEFGLKETWLYESAAVEGSNAKMRMLIVFFDKDTGIYQGHMWFASGLLFGQTR